MLALAALALAVPERAQAQTVKTLVSNTGQPDSGARRPGSREYAQSFDTGANPAGYALDSIVLDLQTVPTGTGTLTVTVHEDVSSLPSETVLYTLTNPTFAVGLNEFKAPTNAELDPNETYWVGGSSLCTYDVSAAGQPAALARLPGARRGLVRIALLLVATLRVPQDVARGIWTLPADFRAFRQLQDGLQGGLRQPTDEDMLDRYFGAPGHASEAPGADKVRPCRTRF